ncbi:hypothetical protein [Pedobacter sp. N23S346]|uniref:hypothetical protein n=1 Tax=Pedobacter sp. N23S346 TaxID=3402750 RepID=UPI003ACFDB4D
MKIKAFTLLFVFQFIIITTFAQKSAGLGSLLNKNAEFIFPQTTEKISAALNVKAVISDNEADGERYAEWITKSGLGIYTTIENKQTVNEIWFGIPDDKFVVVSGLPYHLTLNKTTVQEALAKFSKYKVKKTKPDLYGPLEGGTKLEVKIGDRYVTLFFKKENILESVYILLSFIDPAAG